MGGQSQQPTDQSLQSGAAYLATLDRWLPRRVVGFYITGSAALDAFRPGRSDVDFVAVLNGRLTRAELARLRSVQLLCGIRNGANMAMSGRSPLTGTCNGVMVDTHELSRPVSEIEPIASQSGYMFKVGEAFDVNPVMWKLLTERGIALRGVSADRLSCDAQPGILKDWTRRNLMTYWQPWAIGCRAHPVRSFWWEPRRKTAWGVLGVTRLHRTMARGDVISKEAAGDYALAVFEPRWHPLILEALAYRQHEPSLHDLHGVRRRARSTADFVLHVIDCAMDL